MKREEHFEIGDTGELHVVTASSDIVLKSGEPGTIHVVIEGGESAINLFDITHVGDLVSIRLRKEGTRRWLQPKTSIEVTLPSDSDVEIKTASGDVFGSVDTRDLDVATASGDVRFGDIAQHAKIKAASGDVSVGVVSGDLFCVSASGDFRADTVTGELSVSTASGDISVGEAEGRTVAKSASGDTRIGRFSGPSLNVKSMSGDVIVGLAPGMLIDADIATISGNLRNDVSPSDVEPTMPAKLRIKTMSGDVVLR